LIQLVAIAEAFKPLDHNPKAKMGAAYQHALDASLDEFGMTAAMVVTPRCDDEHQALAYSYGADGKHVVADGNTRLERLVENGFRRAIVFPGKIVDGKFVGLDYESVLAGGPAATATLAEYATAVAGGEKIATAVCNPLLVSPAAIKKFVLTFDRSRAKYDEGMAQELVRQLIEDHGEKEDAVLRLAAIRREQVKQTLEKERAARDAAGRDAPKPVEALLAERRAQKQAAVRVSVGPFLLTVEQSRELRDLMDSFRGKVQADRFLQVWREAKELGVDEDALLALAVHTVSDHRKALD